MYLTLRLYLNAKFVYIVCAEHSKPEVKRESLDMINKLPQSLYYLRSPDTRNLG